MKCTCPTALAPAVIGAAAITALPGPGSTIELTDRPDLHRCYCAPSTHNECIQRDLRSSTCAIELIGSYATSRRVHCGGHPLARARTIHRRRSGIAGALHGHRS